MNGRRIEGLPETPLNAGDAVSKAYVDALSRGLEVREPVALSSVPSDQMTLDNSTFFNGTLTSSINGLLSLDGTPVTNGSRVLIKDLLATQFAGIYTVTSSGSVVTPWILARATDALLLAYIFGTEGATGAFSGWFMATPAPFTINTTPQTWNLFFSSSGVTAGHGIQVSGNEIRVKEADEFTWTGSHSFQGLNFELGATESAVLKLEANEGANKTFSIESQNADPLGSADLVLKARNVIASSCAETRLLSPANVGILEFATVRELQQFAALVSPGGSIFTIHQDSFPTQSSSLLNFHCVGHSPTPNHSLGFQVSAMITRRAGSISFSLSNVAVYTETGSPFSTTVTPVLIHTAPNVVLSISLPIGVSLQFRTHVRIEVCVT